MQKPYINHREYKLISVEIENCKTNIGFYKEQIENMEKKIEELEQLRKLYEDY